MFQGWLWVVIALTVFAADFAVRLYRRNHSTYQVSKVVHLPGDVTQFTLTTKQTLLLKPGQVVLEVAYICNCFRKTLLNFFIWENWLLDTMSLHSSKLGSGSLLRNSKLLNLEEHQLFNHKKILVLLYS